MNTFIPEQKEFSSLYRDTYVEYHSIEYIMDKL